MQRSGTTTRRSESRWAGSAPRRRLAILTALALGALAPGASAEDLMSPLSAAACPTGAPRKPLKVAALMSLVDQRDAPVAPRQSGAADATLPAPDSAVEPGEPIMPAEATPLARPFRPIGQVTLDAALPPGLTPGAAADAQASAAETVPVFDDERRLGVWAHVNKQWAATNMHHRPLYFEEVNLERYGYTPSRCLQPVLSGARFFVTVPALPYMIAAQPQHCTCIYTLGHYRPGSCVPRRPHCPLAGRHGAGIAMETVVAVGLVFLIP
ncbi:MAG: hypothetical protein KF688_08255 [Pirellulales bacterium]|nr:hypothetical protein [Pirellulales bacterium]